MQLILNGLGWLHGLLFRGVLWLLRLPFKALWATILSVLALLGEEFRRWAGLVVSGLLIFLAGKGTMRFAPAEVRRPLVLTVLLLTVIWALAVRRAAHFTAHNNLIKVRQRQAFKELRGDVNKIGEGIKEARGGVIEGMAKRAKGTPLEGAFGSNRQARAKAYARAEAAALRRAEARQAQAEADRVAAEAEATRQAADHRHAVAVRRASQRSRVRRKRIGARHDQAREEP